MRVSAPQQRGMQEGDLFSNRALGVAGSRGPSGLQAPRGSVGWVLVGALSTKNNPCLPAVIFYGLIFLLQIPPLQI